MFLIKEKKCYLGILNNLIVVTHEMAYAHEVSNLVVFLDDWRIAVSGKPDEVLVNPSHERLHAFQFPIRRGATPLPGLSNNG